VLIPKLFLVFILAGFCGAPAQSTPQPAPQEPNAPAVAPTPATEASKPAVVSPELAAIEDKIDAKQFDAAKPPLLHYLEAHANDARALFDLGYLNEATDQSEAAESEYRKAIAADPQQFESRLALGLLLARQDHMAEARDQLQAATERQPAAPDPGAQAQAYRALAELDLTADPPAAKQALLTALKLSPETVGDLLLTARIASANGDQETAEAAYRQLITRQPESVEGLAGLAHILVQQKKYEEARPLLQSALARIPNDPGLNMQMASLLAAEGKPEESIASLEKLHAKLPNDTQLDQMLADAYLSAHHPEQAEPILSVLLKSQPDNVDLLDEEGQSLIYEQRFDEAAKVFDHTTKLKADDLDAWSGLAFADSRLHRDADTLKALFMRSKLAPDTPSTLFLWAISYDNLHQAKLAAAYYQRFLDTAKGKFPDQEWQAHHRLVALGQVH
jgi:predicted Zn-dependent protease